MAHRGDLLRARLLLPPQFVELAMQLGPTPRLLGVRHRLGSELDRNGRGAEHERAQRRCEQQRRVGPVVYLEGTRELPR